MTLEDVARLRDHPIQMAAAPLLKHILDGYMGMSAAILCTDDPVGFITSDHPCVWVDPGAYERPYQMQGVGLGWKTVEVTMPISPRQCLLLSHDEAWTGFLDVDKEGLRILNARHIRACNEAFVARRKVLPEAWMDVLQDNEQAASAA